ncbi:MAG: winged helix-turn-helix transcriptional regulator [Polyangiaceae bacterium]|jgi:DNA-binding transcriptional ArsR family regulator|nr:winged helix-turn-helix transcriptional regulator [Polyangiaceae bacterium]
MANAAKVLNALGDPTRRRIFELVASRPRSVADAAEHVPVSRPAVSQHLRVLKSAGLVRDRAEGTRRIYELDQDGLVALRAYLDRFWDRALSRFQMAAERAARTAEANPSTDPDKEHS